MLGDPEQVDPPRLEFNDERHVQAGEREGAVDVEEIAGQERGGVGSQESSPGSVMRGWRRDSVGAQDLADGGGRHPGARAGAARPGS